MHGNDVIPRVRRRRTKLRHGRMVPGRNIERERERERERGEEGERGTSSPFSPFHFSCLSPLPPLFRDNLNK